MVDEHGFENEACPSGAAVCDGTSFLLSLPFFQAFLSRKPSTSLLSSLLLPFLQGFRFLSLKPSASADWEHSRDEVRQEIDAGTRFIADSVTLLALYPSEGSGFSLEGDSTLMNQMLVIGQLLLGRPLLDTALANTALAGLRWGAPYDPSTRYVLAPLQCLTVESLLDNKITGRPAV